MANTIQIKRRTSAGLPSGLAAGELAVNLSDNKLYVGNAAEDGVIHLNPSASTSYLPLAGGTLTGSLTTNGDIIINKGNGTLRLNDTTNGSDFVIFSNSSELRMAVNGGSFPSAYLNLTTGGNLGLGVTGASERLEVSGNAKVGGSVYINDTNTRIVEGGSNSVRLQTDSGYVDVGPQNASYSHFQTDRSRFYFNKELIVDSGIIRSYNEDLVLDASFVSSTAKNIILRTGNVEKIRMDTDGALLINTTSKGSNTAGKLYIGSPLATSAAIAQINGLVRLQYLITHSSGTGASAHSGLQPNTNNTGNVGNTDYRYYGGYFNVGDFSGNLTVGGTLLTAGGSDANLRLRSDSNRSGLFIDKPGTTTVMGSALVLASDESYRLGTANYYHVVCQQGGGTLLQYQGNTKLTTNSSGVEVGNDGNTDYALIGPTKIGGGFGHGDYAGFSHRDRSTTTSYALLQHTAGTTYLNSNVRIYMGVNNANYTAQVESDRFQVNNALKLNDNSKIKLGDSDDLQIYHNGSDSIIADSGTGGIKIDSNYTAIRSANGSETAAKFLENGAVELYHDNSKKFETIYAGAKINGLLRTVSSTYSGIECQNTDGVWESFIGTESGGGGNRYNAKSSVHKFYLNSTLGLTFDSTGLTPSGSKTLGSNASRWSTIYGVAGNFSGHVTLAGDATGILYFGSKRALEGQISNNNLDLGEHFANIRMRSSADVFPTNSVNLGTSSNRWATIYGSAGDFSGDLTVGGHTDGQSSSTISASSKIDVADITTGAFRFYSTAGFRGGLGTDRWASGISGTEVDLALYVNGDNDFNIWTNNVKRATFNSTGVGIGTTSPSAKLHVNKTGVGDNVIAEVLRLSTLNSASPSWSTTDGLCIGAEMKKANGTTITKQPIKFRYDGGDMATTFEEGKVGIGTASPNYKLQVVGTFRASDSGYFAKTSGTGLTVDHGTSFGTITSDAHSFKGNVDIRSATGSVGLTVGNTTGDTRLQITSSENSDVTLNVGDASGMGTSRSLIFKTGNSHRMSLTSTGLGIGTASPDYTLTVNAGTTNEIARFQSTDNDALISIKDDTDAVYIGLDASSDIMSLGFSNSFASTNLNINTAGNVGIGTTAPNAVNKLEVNGQARATSAIFGNSATSNPADKPVHIKYGGPATIRLEDSTSSNRVYDITCDHGSGLHIYEGTGSSTPRLSIAETTGYVQVHQLLGVGTASPSSKVHIVDNSNATTGLKIDNTNTGTSARNGVVLLNDSGSKAAMYLPSTNYTGVSGWANRLVFSTDSNISGGILMRPATGGFQVSTSGVNNNDFVVTSAGRCGIGTTTPSRPLHVYGGGTNFVAEFESTDDKASILLRDDTTLTYAHSHNGYLSLGGQSSLNANNLNINSSTGHVGIGTTSPSAKLHVAGDILRSGTYYNGWVSKSINTLTSGGSTINYILIALKTTINVRLSGRFKCARGNGVSAVSVAHADVVFCTDNDANPQSGGIHSAASDIPSYGHPKFEIVELTYNSADYYALKISPSVSWVASFNHIEFEGVANNVTWTNVGTSDVSSVAAFQGSKAVFAYNHANVGIGTTSPEGLLSFKADESDTPKIRFQNQHSDNADAAISTYDDTSGTTVLIGSNLYINSSGSTTRFNTGEESAGFRADRGGLLQFYTGGTGATASERIRVAADGSVGIGTTSPALPLHVSHTGFGQLRLTRDSTDDRHWDFLVATNGYLSIRPNNTINTSNEYVTIRDSGNNEKIRLATADDSFFMGGNVGINTSSPSAKLHVNGDSYFSSDMGIGMMASSTYRLSVSDTNNTPLQLQSTSNSLNLTLGSATQTSYTNILFNSSSGNAQIWKNGGSNSDYGGTGSLNLYCSNGAIAFHPGANQNEVVIHSDGDVDIAENLGVGGTHSGSYKLYVNGTSYFSDDISLGGYDTSRSEKLKFHDTGGEEWYVEYNDGLRFVETGNAERFKLLDGGNIDTPDQDKYARFGRARVGYIGHLDYAGFAHRDQSTTTNYALLQSSAGATFLNSASGQTIYFRQANANVGGIVSGNWGLGTVSPGSYKLYVNGTSYFANVAHIRYTASGSLTVPLTIENNGIAASTAVGINFKTYDRYSRIKSERTGQNEGTDLVFEVDGTASGQGYTQALRLKESGQTTFANAFTFPTSDGSANQVLQTDGSGNVSWATVSSSGGSGTVSSSTTTSSTTDGEVAIYTASTTVKQAAKLYYNGSEDSLTIGQTSSASGASSDNPLYVNGGVRASTFMDKGSTTYWMKPAGDANSVSAQVAGGIFCYGTYSDVSAPSGFAGIHAKYVSSYVRLFAADGIHNTQISPHNEDGDWEFNSTDTRTKKRTRINMTKLIRKIEELTGEEFIMEDFVE